MGVRRFAGRVQSRGGQVARKQGSDWCLLIEQPRQPILGVMIGIASHHGRIAGETIFELRGALQLASVIGRRCHPILGLVVIRRDIQIKDICPELPEETLVSQTKRPDDTIRTAGEGRHQLSPMPGSIFTSEGR